MSETLRVALEDIRRKLNAGVYQNEEHVRLSLVARIVQALGWDIWNPAEVNTEFPIPSIESGRKRSDIALLQGEKRFVFIEVKGPNKNLSDYEDQVNQYNYDFRAPFCILTNGRMWCFYYIYSEFEFRDSMFKGIDLMDGDLDDIELSLEAFLAKDDILNGNARQEAERELQKTEIQRTLESLVSEAKKIADDSGTRSTVSVLIDLMKAEGHIISENDAKEAYDNWRKRGEIPVKPPPPLPPLSPQPLRPLRDTDRTAEEAPYVERYRRQLRNSSSMPRKVLDIIELHSNVNYRKLLELLSKQGYARRGRTGSVDASLKVLETDGFIRIDGRGEMKKLSFVKTYGQ